MIEQISPGTPVSAALSECDVWVIGGGLAGSTIGALLAQRGHQVVIPEKEHHLRFHIGESLPVFKEIHYAAVN